MMKQIKSLYFVLCLMVGAFTLSGCIEEYEADISSEDSDLLVEYVCSISYAASKYFRNGSFGNGRKSLCTRE